MIIIIKNERKWNIQVPFVQLAGGAEENFRHTEACLNCYYTGKTVDKPSFIQ